MLLMLLMRTICSLRIAVAGSKISRIVLVLIRIIVCLKLLMWDECTTSLYLDPTVQHDDDVAKGFDLEAVDELQPEHAQLREPPRHTSSLSLGLGRDDAGEDE